MSNLGSEFNFLYLHPPRMAPFPNLGRGPALHLEGTQWRRRKRRKKKENKNVFFQPLQEISLTPKYVSVHPVSVAKKRGTAGDLGPCKAGIQQGKQSPAAPVEPRLSSGRGTRLASLLPSQPHTPMHPQTEPRPSRGRLPPPGFAPLTEAQYLPPAAALRAIHRASFRSPR